MCLCSFMCSCLIGDKEQGTDQRNTDIQACSSLYSRMKRPLFGKYAVILPWWSGSSPWMGARFLLKGKHWDHVRLERRWAFDGIRMGQKNLLSLKTGHWVENGSWTQASLYSTAWLTDAYTEDSKKWSSEKALQWTERLSTGKCI